MMQALAGWMSITGEPGGAADEERSLARRPLRRVRGGDRHAGGALARAARRRRLRLRRLPLRDGARRARATSARGSATRGLRARRGGATRRTRRSSRSRTSRRRTAGSSSRARSRSSGERLCDAIGRPELARTTRVRRLRRARRATASELLADPRRRSSARGRPPSGSSGSPRVGVPSAPVNDVAAALEDPQTVARGASSSSTTRDSAPCGRSRRRSGSATARRRSAAAPFRGEHTEAVLASCAATRPSSVQELAEAGVFGDPPVGADAAVPARWPGRALTRRAKRLSACRESTPCSPSANV